MSTDAEHGLRVEIARLTKERDELKLQVESKHNALIALREQCDEAREACAAAKSALAAANAELAIWRDEDAREAKYEAVSRRCTAAETALADARRDLQDADRLFLGTLAGIVTAIPGDSEQIDAWLRDRVAHAKYQYDEQRKARAALAAPAHGRDPATEDADAAWRDGEAHGRDK